MARGLARAAVIVFDDYGHPDCPGVREAVRELGLDGEQRAGLWIYRVPRSEAQAGENPG